MRIDLRHQHAVAAMDLDRPQHLARLKTGGHQDHIDLMTTTGGIDDHAALYMVDRLGDQLDIRTAQRLIPAVVDQDAFAVGRIVGQAFLDQVGAPLELAEQVVGELLTLAIVAVVHRALGRGPVGVAPHGGQQTITETPHQTEAIPGVVVGDVLEQPLRLGADRAVIVLRRSRPLGRTLEDGDMLGFLRHRTQKLHGACAGADHADPFALERDIAAPARRVPRRAGEGVDALDGAELRDVEKAHRGDHRIGPARAQTAVGLAGDDFPATGVLVPVHRDHLDTEFDIPAQVEIGRNPALIVEHLVALGVVAAPVEVGRKRIRIEVVGRIDTGLGVIVLEPGATDLGVLVDHRKVQPHLLEAPGRAQTGEPGADHQHLEVGQARRRRRRAPVDAPVAKAHFLEGHRRVFGRHALAQTHAHHLDQLVLGGRRRQAAGAAVELIQHPGQTVADGLLDLRRQAAAGLGEDRDVALGQKRLLQPCRVAGDLGQAHQQRRDRRLLQCNVSLDSVHFGFPVNRSDLTWMPAASRSQVSAVTPC